MSAPMAGKFIKHIRNESYVDFVKEAKNLLDAEHERCIREYMDILLRQGHLVQPKQTDATQQLAEAALSRKHFKMAADAVKAIEDRQKRYEMAMHHVAIFAKSNPRFDKERFLKAADVEEVADEPNKEKWN